MRLASALCVPILAFALSACVATPVDPDCPPLQAVVAAHADADDSVQPLDEEASPADVLLHYTGLQALGDETTAAADVALAEVTDPERVEALEAVRAAAEDLSRTSIEAIALVEVGDDPQRLGPDAVPGFVRLELTGAMSVLELDPCSR